VMRVAQSSTEDSAFRIGTNAFIASPPLHSHSSEALKLATHLERGCGIVGRTTIQLRRK
jgi:hypothetical protein